MTNNRNSFDAAVAAYDRGQKDRAAAICRRRLAAEPQHLDSLRMLGIIARDAAQYAESLAWFERALSVLPRDPVLRFERGTTFYQQGNLERAIDDYCQALEAKPNFQEAALNVGALREQQCHFDEALPWAELAVRLRPSCAKAQYNLGNIHRSLGQLVPAAAAYQESLAQDPHNAKAHWNLAHVYLLQGDFERAWPEHEWRQRAAEVFFDRHTQPRWDGSPLAGKTLLVHAEQGIGDEVMFASCYPDVIARAAHCIFVCDPRLEALFKRSFPQATVYAHQRVRDWVPLAVSEPVDWQIPAGSLPLYLRRSTADFPLGDRFLSADPAAIDRWRECFAQLGPGPKIGISWRAGGRPSERRRRTTELEAWRQLFDLDSVSWINLQYGDTTDDLEAARRELGVEIHDFAAGDPLVDLDEFAAKVAALDLVVSVGNATVHLAGALGVPAWAVLPPVPGWRWQIAGTTSPWYSSVRLYRQPTTCGWDEVFRQVQHDLAAKFRLRPAARPATAVRLATGAGENPKPAALRPHAEHELLKGTLDAEEFSEHAVPAALNQALEHHRLGQLERAEQIYREILHHLPRNIEAQRLLGLLARQTGRLELAISSLRRALAAGDALPDTGLHLGGSLRDAGRLDEALAAYRAVARQVPDSAEARVGAGKTLAQLFRADEAMDELREAVRLDPLLPEAHHALARLLLEDGAATAALEACDRALAVRPDYALALSTRALALESLERTDEAALSVRLALAADPQNAALELFLARLEQTQGHVAAAEQACRRALAVDPTNIVALNNLGLALDDQGRLAEALQTYDAALDRDGNFAPARMNRALGRLRLGRWREGWADYRWRWQCAESGGLADCFSQPRWDGSPLADRTILVYGEQSLGDELVFASCLPDLASEARQVALLCDPRLAALFSRSFPRARVFGVARGWERLWRAPAGLEIDVQAPAGDLPEHFRAEAASFPPRSGFLAADPLRVAAWRRALARLGPGPKVGISWRAGEKPLDRLRRSAPLGHWHPLLEAGGLFVALERGDCGPELSLCQQAGGRVCAVQDIGPLGDVDDVAALLAALDLVVTVGNLHLHLAAAVGTPVWGVFPDCQQWPWLMQNERMAWYPEVQVYRQQDPGDWTELFERLTADFLNLPASSRRHRSEEGAISA